MRSGGKGGRVSGLSEQHVDDWRRTSCYKGYTKDAGVVKWFWQLMESWSPSRRSAVLQLATGTSPSTPSPLQS